MTNGHSISNFKLLTSIPLRLKKTSRLAGTCPASPGLCAGARGTLL